MNNQNEFLNWNSSFTAEESQFVLLDEGIYNFKITKMDKKVYDGNSPKIPNGTPYAELNLQIQTDEGTANVRDRLYLLKNLQWKLSEFFASIGQPVVVGKTFSPNWNTVVGSTGKAEVTQRQYVGQDGNNHTTNQVHRYLRPQDQAPASNANLNNQQNSQTQQPQQFQPAQPQMQQMPFPQNNQNNNGQQQGQLNNQPQNGAF